MLIIFEFTGGRADSASVETILLAGENQKRRDSYRRAKLLIYHLMALIFPRFSPPFHAEHIEISSQSEQVAGTIIVDFKMEGERKSENNIFSEKS